jgi:hypothetical protein
MAASEVHDETRKEGGLLRAIALVWSGIVQGFSVPPLLLIMMLMTNDPKIMGGQVNSGLTNMLGWITTLAAFAASGELVRVMTVAVSKCPFQRSVREAHLLAHSALRSMGRALAAIATDNPVR